MTIIALLVVCILAGGALYVLSIIPLDLTFKQIIRVIIILALVIYAVVFLASMLGLTTGLPPLNVR